MVQISNIVCSADLGCTLDLRLFTLQATNVHYDAKKHNVVSWRHRKIGGHCFVYAKGKLVCNGGVSSKEEARRRIRRYARKIQQMGYQVRRNFPRNRVVVEGFDSQWEADLMDLSALASDNRGYRYALVTIDVFSRYVCCRAIKQKTASQVLEAFRAILGEGRTPKALRTDKGKEFKNKQFQSFCKENNIHFFTSQNETKCAYVERVIKTVKMKIFRLTSIQKNYIDHLDDLISSYNHTRHRSLGTSPSDVSKENESEVRLQQYLIRKGKTNKRGAYRFKPGDLVRISHLKRKFDREYQQKFTGKIFRIKSRRRRQNIPVYTLEDWDKEPIEGTFYNSELQRVLVDKNTSFRIEKILKRKKGQVLVRWLFYSPKFDSLIKASEVKNYL
ncbi:uncharacterized protein LOC133198352 [Saccostrea echinata]|uniref:uncharacterized protein LOC133198352 n=1 Tax=Saccostrea echinata TaxID=191078 RepID=UPI002A7F3001|nr:uncharacterized protein LOC133198352 [Saccostrea echinata]